MCFRMVKSARGTGPQPVQSVVRSLDLLDALGSESLGLVALAERTGLQPSTAYRLLGTLQRRGYVSRNLHTGQFRIGHRLLELAALATSASETLRATVRPHLEQLRDVTDETANLVVLDQLSIVYIDQVESPRAIRMFTSIGRRVPLHASAAGKAILAISSEALLNDRASAGLDRLTRNTLGSRQPLEQDLATTRDRGFAVDNEEYELGVVCVAAVIIGPDGGPAGAISVSGPTERMRDADLARLGKLVRRHAAEASSELGGSPPREA
jgi:IclR family acetate operon transcriptional repressor